jgi:hypothetical protein
MRLGPESIELAEATTPPDPTSMNVPVEEFTVPTLVIPPRVKDRAVRFCPTLSTWLAVRRFESLIVTVPVPVVIMADASTTSPAVSVTPMGVDTEIVVAKAAGARHQQTKTATRRLALIILGFTVSRIIHNQLAG